MERRRWSAPVMAPSQGRAADLSDASGRSRGSQWGALEYLVSFVFCMLFFGLIAALLRSRFPIDLGLFFFFTNDELIEWGLRKVGIRLVPESLGATFISAFVWLAGASLLSVRWRDPRPRGYRRSFPPVLLPGISLLVWPSGVPCSRPSRRRSSESCSGGSGLRSLLAA